MTANSLFRAIDRHIAGGNQVIVTIDGMAAAGKTTLAALLCVKYCCSVIAMDHFFLTPEQRVPQRLSEPGGNIDYERFLDEVYRPLQKGRPFSYRPYDCGVQKFTEPVPILPGNLTVIEGVYSYLCMYIKTDGSCLNDSSGNSTFFPLSVFMKVDEHLQSQRLKERSPDLFERFISEWLPMEKKYFDYFNIQNRCDYILS